MYTQKNIYIMYCWNKYKRLFISIINLVKLKQKKYQEVAKELNKRRLLSIAYRDAKIPYFRAYKTHPYIRRSHCSDL